MGGAYGTGMLADETAEALYTYRDPQMKQSYETFAKGPAALVQHSFTEADLTELIVGAAAKLDTPLKPCQEAKEADRRYFCGITDAMIAADRQALCQMNVETLHQQAAAWSRRWPWAHGWPLAPGRLWRLQKSCLTG